MPNKRNKKPKRSQKKEKELSDARGKKIGKTLCVSPTFLNKEALIGYNAINAKRPCSLSIAFCLSRVDKHGPIENLNIFQYSQLPELIVLDFGIARKW